METIEFYPLDIEYDNDAVIRLIGKTTDNKTVCAYDDSLKPYFWAFNDNIEKLKDKISKIKNEEENVYVTNVEIQNKEFLSKDVRALKINYNNPRGVKLILDEIDKSEKQEIDINFNKRYLVDKEITMMTLTKITGEVVQDENFNYS